MGVGVGIHELNCKINTTMQVMARLPDFVVPDGPWRRLADMHLDTEAELGVLAKHNLFWRRNWVSACLCSYVCVYVERACVHHRCIHMTPQHLP